MFAGTGITVTGTQRFAPLLSKVAYVQILGKLGIQMQNMDNLDDSLQFYCDSTHIKPLLEKGEDPSAENNYGKRSLNDMM